MSAPVIAPETDPLAWLKPDASAGHARAQRILLRYDPRRFAAGERPCLWVVTRCQFETGTPAPVYHGRWLEFELGARVNAAALTGALNAGEADHLLRLIAAGHSVAWDGRNLAGALTEEAAAAVAAFRDWLGRCLETSETGGIYAAWDWLQPGEVDIRPEMSDAELAALAKEIEATARAQFDAIVTGTGDYLRELRQAARERED